MKSFLAALVIFLLLLLLILWNYAYIHKVCAALDSMADELPTCAEGDAALDALVAFWERESAFMELSVSHHSIDKVSDCLAEWQSAAKTGDEEEYERCRYLFRSVVAQIKRGESAAIGNWI